MGTPLAQRGQSQLTRALPCAQSTQGTQLWSHNTAPMQKRQASTTAKVTTLTATLNGVRLCSKTVACQLQVRTARRQHSLLTPTRPVTTCCLPGVRNGCNLHKIRIPPHTLGKTYVTAQSISSMLHTQLCKSELKSFASRKQHAHKHYEGHMAASSHLNSTQLRQSKQTGPKPKPKKTHRTKRKISGGGESAGRLLLRHAFTRA